MFLPFLESRRQAENTAGPWPRSSSKASLEGTAAGESCLTTLGWSLQVPSTVTGMETSNYTSCLSSMDAMDLPTNNTTPSTQIFFPFPVPSCVGSTALKGGFHHVYVTPFDPWKSGLYPLSKILLRSKGRAAFCRLSPCSFINRLCVSAK